MESALEGASGVATSPGRGGMELFQRVRSMKSALEGASAVATSREEAEWGGFSEVATSFRPHRAFRLSRPAQDEEAGSLAMPREVPNAIGLRSGSN